MLELIFQGFVEWIYGLILEAWEHFASSLLDLMSMDFAYLEEHIPIIPTIRQALLAIGWALLLGNLVFQATKSMLSGLGFEGDDPRLLFSRTFAFSFLLLASPQICDLCLNMTEKMIEVLRVPTAVHISFADDSTFFGLAGAWLFVAICGIVIMFKSFKLIIEMAERYFVLAMLTISAPLAFSMGGSKNTSDIFNGWCRMYGSMCLLMVLNVVFVKMLFSVLAYVPSGLDVLPWMVLVLTIVKVAKKADAIITRIGLNPAISGDTLGGRSLPGMLTYVVARTMVSNAARALGSGGGKNGGMSGNRNPRPNTPPGGFGAGGSNSHTGGAYAGTASNRTTQGVHTHRSASQAAVQQNTTQQESQNQNTAVQFGGQQSSVSDQRNTANQAAGNQVFPGGAAGNGGNQTRNTSVPAGIHRPSDHPRTSFGTTGAGIGASFSAQAFNRPTATDGKNVRSGKAGNENVPSAATAAFGKAVQNPPSGMAGTAKAAVHSPVVAGANASPKDLGTAGKTYEAYSEHNAQSQKEHTLRSAASGTPNTEFRRPGIVGTPTSASLSGNAEKPDANSSRNTVPKQAGKTLPGTAGTGRPNAVRSGAGIGAGIAPSGKAGNSSSSSGSIPRPGALGHSNTGINLKSGSGSGAPLSAEDRRTAGAANSGQSPVNSTVLSKEQNHITVNQKTTGASLPGETGVSSAPAALTKELPGAGNTRSTHRPPSENPIPHPGAAALTARPTDALRSKQAQASGNGTAGNAFSSQKAGERSTGTFGEKQPAALAASPRTRVQPSQTARQEHKGASAETRSRSRGLPAVKNETAAPERSGTASALRNGTAGRDAPARLPVRSSAAKQSSLGRFAHTGSVSSALESSGGKKALSAATGANQRFSGKSERSTKRKARKTGGKKRGKT